jgi:hypothetical protein
MKATPKISRLFQSVLLVASCLATYDTALAQGKNGTTLAGYKTIDICAVGNGDWRYYGLITLWNEGAVNTEGLSIKDQIQYKTGTDWLAGPYVNLTVPGFIPAATTEGTATVIPYSVDNSPLPGTIRNVASITIMNHSGSLGIPKGPEPKATFLGEVKPCDSVDTGGCSYTQGYWGSKPNVVWPSPYDRSAMFYLSGLTWQGIMDSPVKSAPGYYQLAQQYIAAVLNVANNASAPQGVTSTISAAAAWLTVTSPVTCSTKGSCGLQKDWAATLARYNEGSYPGGPKHCE